MDFVLECIQYLIDQAIDPENTSRFMEYATSASAVTFFPYLRHNQGMEPPKGPTGIRIQYLALET